LEYEELLICTANDCSGLLHHGAGYNDTLCQNFTTDGFCLQACNNGYWGTVNDTSGPITNASAFYSCINGTSLDLPPLVCIEDAPCDNFEDFCTSQDDAGAVCVDNGDFEFGYTCNCSEGMHSFDLGDGSFTCGYFYTLQINMENSLALRTGLVGTTFYSDETSSTFYRSAPVFDVSLRQVLVGTFSATNMSDSLFNSRRWLSGVPSDTNHTGPFNVSDLSWVDKPHFVESFTLRGFSKQEAYDSVSFLLSVLNNREEGDAGAGFALIPDPFRANFYDASGYDISYGSSWVFNFSVSPDETIGSIELRAFGVQMTEALREYFTNYTTQLISTFRPDLLPQHFESIYLTVDEYHRENDGSNLVLITSVMGVEDAYTASQLLGGNDVSESAKGMFAPDFDINTLFWYGNVSELFNFSNASVFSYLDLYDVNLRIRCPGESLSTWSAEKHYLAQSALASRFGYVFSPAQMITDEINEDCGGAICFDVTIYQLAWNYAKYLYDQSTFSLIGDVLVSEVRQPVPSSFSNETYADSSMTFYVEMCPFMTAQTFSTNISDAGLLINVLNETLNELQTPRDVETGYVEWVYNVVSEGSCTLVEVETGNFFSKFHAIQYMANLKDVVAYDLPQSLGDVHAGVSCGELVRYYSDLSELEIDGLSPLYTTGMSVVETCEDGHVGANNQHSFSVTCAGETPWTAQWQDEGMNCYDLDGCYYDSVNDVPPCGRADSAAVCTDVFHADPSCSDPPCEYTCTCSAGYEFIDGKCAGPSSSALLVETGLSTAVAVVIGVCGTFFGLCFVLIPFSLVGLKRENQKKNPSLKRSDTDQSQHNAVDEFWEDYCEALHDQWIYLTNLPNAYADDYLQSRSNKVQPMELNQLPVGKAQEDALVAARRQKEARDEEERRREFMERQRDEQARLQEAKRVRDQEFQAAEAKRAEDRRQREAEAKAAHARLEEAKRMADKQAALDAARAAEEAQQHAAAEAKRKADEAAIEIAKSLAAEHQAKLEAELKAAASEAAQAEARQKAEEAAREDEARLAAARKVAEEHAAAEAKREAEEKAAHEARAAAAAEEQRKLQEAEAAAAAAAAAQKAEQEKAEAEAAAVKAKAEAEEAEAKAKAETAKAEEDARRAEQVAKESAARLEEEKKAQEAYTSKLAEEAENKKRELAAIKIQAAQRGLVARKEFKDKKEQLLAEKKAKAEAEADKKAVEAATAAAKAAEEASMKAAEEAKKELEKQEKLAKELKEAAEAKQREMAAVKIQAIQRGHSTRKKLEDEKKARAVAVPGIVTEETASAAVAEAVVVPSVETPAAENASPAAETPAS